MRRQIRLRIDVVVEVDDDRDGVPFVGDPGPALERVALAILPAAGVTRVLPGGRVEVALTRESLAAAKKAWRGRSARPTRSR